MLTPREYRKVKTFLTNLLYQPNETRTHFAKMYNIKSFSDFYDFFKLLNNNFKQGKFDRSFKIINDIIKCYTVKLWKKNQNVSTEKGFFKPVKETLELIGLCIDNLEILKRVLKQIENEGISDKDLIHESIELEDFTNILVEALKKVHRR